MAGPFDRFLRPNSGLGDLLRRELKPGEEASVLGEIHKNGTEIDADLFRKLDDGRIGHVAGSHVELDPKTMKPLK